MFIYFCFLFNFNFLTVHHKNLPRVIFTKKWLLTNIFTSTRSLCFCVLFCLFVYLSVFGVYITPELMNRSYKTFFVGRTWSKEEVTNFWERPGSYFGYKKSFLCILMILVFYLIFLQK